MKNCFWLGLTLIILSTLNSTVAQENGDAAPYLYYYDDKSDDFVIERADGTDRRILGEGLMPDDINGVGGPGWSPSGEWFAWIGYRHDPYRGYNHPRAWVISADGSRVAGYFEAEDYEPEIEMQWSPNADLLLVSESESVFWDERDRIEATNVRFTLLDPTTDSPLATLLTVTSLYSHSAKIMWTLDGRYAIGRTVRGSYENPRTHFYIFDTQGTMREVVIAGEHELPSPNGDILCWQGEALVLENILTSVQRPIVNLTDETSEDERLWNHEINWNITANFGYRTAYKLLDVAMGELIELPGPPDIAAHFGWSPAGQYLFYTTYPVDGETPLENVHIFDTVTRQVTDFPVTLPSFEWASWGWVDENRVLVATHGTNGLSTYLLEVTGTFQEYNAEIAHAAVPKLSPDGRYIAGVVDGPVIYEIATGATSSFRPDSRSVASYLGGTVLWHPEQDWLILGDEAVTASGWRGLRWVGIMRADGSQRRELTYCIGMARCIDWLPEQVEVENLPPSVPTEPLPKPLQVFRGTDWVYSFIWSPDGKQVAIPERHSDGYGIYAMASGTVIASGETASHQVNEWQANSQASNPVWGNESTLAVSADGTMVVAFREEVLGIFDGATGAILHELGSEMVASQVGTLAFSPDGRWLAVGFRDGPMQLWDVLTGEMVGSLPYGSSSGSKLAFSPDSTQLAVVVAWDLEIYAVQDLVGR